MVDASALITLFLALVSGGAQLILLWRGRQMITGYVVQFFLLASSLATLYFVIPYGMLAYGAPPTIGAVLIRPAVNALLASTMFLAMFTYQYYQVTAVVEEARGERRRLRLLQDQFVNILFHELRTPLTAILAYTEMALADDGFTEPEQLWDGIHRAGVRLKVLIDQAAALRRGLEMAPFDLAETIKILLTRDAVWVATRRTPDMVDVLYAGDEHLVVEGDAVKLETAVLELVRNAVKATGEGGTVIVKAHATNGHYVVEVKDDGVGMSVAKLDQLFVVDTLDFLDMSDTRQHEGSGLGLAVVGHVAEVHGGYVEVTSQLGVGSVFRLKLPKHG